MHDNHDTFHNVSILINNQHILYNEVRLQCGVTSMVRPEVLSSCPVILEYLNADVSQCLRILPVSVHPLVRRTRIWVNLTYCYGRCDEPEHVNHTTAHHHQDWLLWARDIVDKTLGIEIYSALDYLRMRHHWNGSGLILHEFCHLIHQQVFGLECERIKLTYDRSYRSRRYENVLRRDWAGKKEGETDLAYAMIDCKEFFAEMSVTFLANGYRELDCAPSHLMEQCSPVITEPSVLKRLQALGRWSHLSSSRRPFFIAWLRPVINFCRGHEKNGHCNKFYPFTGGQLQFYDPSLYNEFKALWSDIAQWDDPRHHEENFCSICWISQKKRGFVNDKNKSVVFQAIEDAITTSTDLEDTVDL